MEDWNNFPLVAGVETGNFSFSLPRVEKENPSLCSLPSSRSTPPFLQAPIHPQTLVPPARRFSASPACSISFPRILSDPLWNDEQ
ncbi:hypothetical protein GUJ93_ZPchr0006g45542 [Zizania palustris]|uniref:Uncharacterized protein n=1 Tax=Zizania palustris TaxID=103762 RepID=A0A8J5T3R6_ZIZPA|nr:hypothetical protein GUJ93_ZPchr0006g45542 [Zizania palustris]